jgi:hypothetical protein
MIQVRVSAASARLRFVQCGPPCIALGCTAKCCDAPTRVTGCLVAVLPAEEAELRRRGVSAADGLLKPNAGQRRCPAKRDDHLCSLHDAGLKPLGCVASPFFVNRTGTLVIRNRYKLLPCGKFARQGKGGDAAYRVFRSSLDRLFGPIEAAAACAHLDAGGGDTLARMTDAMFRNMRMLEGAKQAA